VPDKPRSPIMSGASQCRAALRSLVGRMSV
jgi:hypothetical protein